MIPDKLKALHDWVLCRPLKAKKETIAGIVLTSLDLENKTISEGVAEVIDAGPGRWHEKSGQRIASGVRAGDRIVYRGFLRFAHQIGEEFGRHRLDVFALRAEDVLAVLEGSGTIGLYDEYEI